MKKNLFIAILAIIVVCTGACILVSNENQKLEKFKNNKQKCETIEFPILTNDACTFIINVDVVYKPSPLRWNETTKSSKVVKSIIHNNFALKANELTAFEMLDNKLEFWDEVYKSVNDELNANDIILYSISGTINLSENDKTVLNKLGVSDLNRELNYKNKF